MALVNDTHMQAHVLDRMEESPYNSSFAQANCSRMDKEFHIVYLSLLCSLAASTSCHGAGISCVQSHSSCCGIEPLDMGHLWSSSRTHSHYHSRNLSMDRNSPPHSKDHSNPHPLHVDYSIGHSLEPIPFFELIAWLPI